MTQTSTRRPIVSYMKRTGNPLQPWAQVYRVFDDSAERDALVAELRKDKGIRYLTTSN